MSAPARRRSAALFALLFVLAWLAALPCAAAAQGDTCCAPVAGCAAGDAAPCAQLDAAPCCEAPAVPVSAAAAPSLPTAPALLALAPAPRGPVCASLDLSRPPAPLAHVASLRSVMLRL